MSVAEISVAGVETIAMRVSYVGELGWELHIANNDLPTLYQAIMERGVSFGIGQFGSYALNAMRVEKGYHGWGSDFGTEYTLYDAGLQGFAKLAKGNFLGCDAVLLQSQTEPEWEWVGLEVTAPSPWPLASEPILKDGTCIGYVTSGARGARTGKMLALGYVKRGTLAMGERCAIRILGEVHQAIRHSPSQYDPDNLRMRG